MHIMSRITDALPVVSIAPTVQALTPADFVELPYSPLLLLPVVFDVFITSDADYQAGCEAGFDAYFNGMYYCNSDSRMVFVNHFYTQAEVQEDVYAVVSSLQDDTPFLWSIGFYLGLFSALALTDCALATYGVQLLTVLVTQMQGQIAC